MSAMSPITTVPSINRLLKIAFLVEGMYASGVDTSTQLLAHALHQLGCQVVIFMPWKERFTQSCDPNLFLLSGMRVNARQSVHLSYPISWRLINEFKRQRFDLIHVHTSTSVNLLAWQLSAMFDLPIVYTYHTMSTAYTHYLGPLAENMGSLVEAAVELFDKLVCNGATTIIAPSHKAAHYLTRIGIRRPVTVIPNGLQLNDFHPWPSDYLQEQFGVPGGKKILLFVGRLNEEKRPLTAYRIFRELCHTREDICLVMVGDGVLRQALTERSQEDGLQNRFFLTGLIDYARMPAVYNAADLWLSTSQSEVHPMVALEAAACGLPAVAFDDQALEGVVEDEVNGYLVENEQTFLERLQQLLDNGDLYQHMRRATLDKIQPYTIETTSRRTLQLYETVIKPILPPQSGKHKSTISQFLARTLT